MSAVYRSGHGMRLDHLVFSVQYIPVAFAEDYASDTDITPITWHVGDWAVPMERLVPISMRWSSCGELSTLSFRVALGAGQGYSQEAPETAPATTGVNGWLVRMIDQEENEWFRGIVGIDQMVIQADPAHESLSYVAYGPELRLRNRVVSGQWRAKPAIDDKVIADTVSDSDCIRDNAYRYWRGRCIFNEGGSPNASPCNWRLTTQGALAEGSNCRVFEEPNRKAGKATARYWTAWEALASLIEYFDNFHTISRDHTDWSAIHGMLSGVTLPEVDAEGMDLLRAITTVLSSVGYGFALAPWAAGAEGSQHRLYVFPLEDSNLRAFPWLLPQGTSLAGGAGRKAEVKRLHYARDAHNVKNDVRVIGDVKRKQVIFTYGPEALAPSPLLKPYWDTSAVDLDKYAYVQGEEEDGLHLVGDLWWSSEADYTDAKFAEKFASWSQGANREYYHCWRSFALNEDGGLSPTIADIPDLSDLVGDSEGNWSRRARRLGPTFTYDNDDTEGRLCPAFVELGIYDGERKEARSDSWIKIPAHIWPDRIGFTITVPHIMDWRPYARQDELRNTYPDTYLTLLNNTLRTPGEEGGDQLVLRLIGSIETDDVLGSHWRRDGNNAWPMIAEKVIRSSRFRHRTIENRFLTQTEGQSEELLPEDTTNDIEECQDLASRQRAVWENQIGHGSIMIPFVTKGYTPGMSIPYTNGRRIEFYLDATRGSVAPLIRQVVWRFEENNTTEILLETPALRLSR